MNSEAIEASVLRAMLRLARKRQPADDGQIAVRVGSPPRDVRAALRRLDQAGLVERLGESRAAARLTMAGFALAVAGLPRPVAKPGAASRARRAA